MKKTKSNKNKKILLALALLFTGALIYYFVAIHDSSATNNVTQQQGAENVAEGAKVNASNNKDGTSSSNNVEPPNADSQLQGATITVNSFAQSGGYVRATATVNKNSGGTCYYGFSSTDTKPVSRSNQSQNQSSSQLCTVEIPEVEFTKLGAWKMTISFTQNEAKVETSQDVTIN